MNIKYSPSDLRWRSAPSWIVSIPVAERSVETVWAPGFTEDEAIGNALQMHGREPYSPPSATREENIFWQWRYKTLKDWD